MEIWNTEPGVTPRLDSPPARRARPLHSIRFALNSLPSCRCCTRTTPPEPGRHVWQPRPALARARVRGREFYHSATKIFQRLKIGPRRFGPYSRMSVPSSRKYAQARSCKKWLTRFWWIQGARLCAVDSPRCEEASAALESAGDSDKPGVKALSSGDDQPCRLVPIQPKAPLVRGITLRTVVFGYNWKQRFCA
jgi:hypothetical protein